jgi:CHAT domain-containing protein
LSIAKNSGWETVNYSGSDATKQRVTGVASPTILHLATHGFFFDPENATDGLGQSRGLFVKAVEDSSGLGNSGVAELSLRAFKNSPMRQGGIALANAQNTVEAWARGQVVNSENNGVLTAEEIALLDLNKTWIVVLSACQTGVGKARSGEGVFGLRRAFMIAGAENLVMTLWPVADEATASIVADFYSKALSTGNAWESLAEVQRDWLVKLRKEEGLQVAVRDAGPFAMAVMVNPANAGLDVK